ncbi:MAG TPA: methyltransferase domain-containing protein [Pyrinomonadaceae bacterium]|nr:methyltransferase domain-containing protein [Pyrinomonadaceae bacterium]
MGSKRFKTQTPPPRPPIYDAFAPHYERALRPLERLILTRLRAATLRALVGNSDGGGGGDNAGDNNADGVGGRLLEIGAGTGLNFPHYPPGAHGAATEPSREMLRLAQTKPRPAGVSLVQTSAESLPFADDAFDAAFATLVLCSVASPPLAFAELRRVVREGGRVVLLEHVRPPGLLGFVFDAISFFTVRLCEDHFNRRTAEEARRAGLRIVRIEPHALGIIQLIVCEV